MEDELYQGRNRFLRWWPKLLLGLAALTLYVGWSHSTQWVTLFAVVAYVHGRWLPWKFTIPEDGLALLFPFGRRRHFGYLLMNRIGYEPDNEERLRVAFTGFGYNLT